MEGPFYQRVSLRIKVTKNEGVSAEIASRESA